MYHFKLYEFESLYGLMYTFPTRGDGIAMHDHEESQKHNTMVMKGSIQIYGPEKKWCHVLKAGDIFDLEGEHHPHEVVALEDDTMIMGMFIHGKPEDGYVKPKYRQGTINDRMPTMPLVD